MPTLPSLAAPERLFVIHCKKQPAVMSVTTNLESWRLSVFSGLTTMAGVEQHRAWHQARCCTKPAMDGTGGTESHSSPSHATCLQATPVLTSVAMSGSRAASMCRQPALPVILRVEYGNGSEYWPFPYTVSVIAATASPQDISRSNRSWDSHTGY